LFTVVLSFTPKETTIERSIVMPAAIKSGSFASPGTFQVPIAPAK
jgi:hypothetical protein